MALGFMSEPITLNLGNAFARVRAMHPLPNPMSRIVGVSVICAGGTFFNCFISQEHHSSVSGRGIKIGGFTILSRFQNGTVPKMYCIGFFSFIRSLR